METIEYRTQDKSDWGPGAWQDEPDKKQWPDAATGLPCLIKRNHFGALCGYVGLSEEHPLYGKEYGDIDADLDVHGGLTYSDFCQGEEEPAHSICHVVPGEKPVWWLGFDCGHCFDVSPTMAKRFGRDPGSVYRDFAYVTKQVEGLAQQLAAIG